MLNHVSPGSLYPPVSLCAYVFYHSICLFLLLGIFMEQSPYLFKGYLLGQLLLSYDYLP
jgi:hypothetical protein